MEPRAEHEDEASPQTRPHLGWEAGALNLATVLMLSADASVVRRVADLLEFNPTVDAAVLRHDLWPMVASSLSSAADCMARGLGTTRQAQLDFGRPECTRFELTGRLGTVRRLDRIWGGRPEIAISATGDANFEWPGPKVGHAVLLHGEGSMDDGVWSAQRPTAIWPGAVLHAHAGSVFVLDACPVFGWLVEAMGAGYGLAELLPSDAIPMVRVKTALGELVLENKLLRLNRRAIRLTASEARALACLAKNPGKVVRSDELAALLSLRRSGLAHLIVRLRNKIGDGLITTVYGIGYLLEAED